MAESLKIVAMRLRSHGASTDDWLGEIRRLGATQIDSVKLVRELDGISLDQAKAIVDESATWADKREVNREWRERLQAEVEAFEAASQNPVDEED